MSGSIDAVAAVYAFLGSFLMGSSFLAMKAPAVLKAQVHPVVFQTYRSFWVFVAGCGFVLADAVRGEKVVFAFTWWGVLAAVCWIPCGICNIAAVPRLGVALTQAVNPGVSVILNFVAGVALVGQHMKKHGSGGGAFVLAPWYMGGVAMGLVGMVAAIHACKRPALDSVEEAIDEESNEPMKDATLAGSGWALLTGLALAILAGVFSTCQFTTLSFGEQSARAAVGGACAHNFAACPPVLKEQFDNMGSWMASFGIGCAMVTAVYYFGAWAVEAARGRQAPPMHFRVMSRYGSAAGLLWVIGYFFQQAAVVRAGGPAFMQPLNLALQMITSGAWGVFYYREVSCPRRVVFWLIAVSMTITFAVLLNAERSAQ
eukprot:CAMPEP_0198490508 /NCGR_PEP_ID=MMETSP1462-20131121/2180_1 /TAXON_ID=1333877 /ORGANISM="Brandtodinium nutriculum, Strain RCC3387" /LENGTH=371 /DNA_ID=CAMNT_0044219073 /DNA_START=101 /DNA_END=1216 /DNA_ORIENTATION=+